MDVVRMNIIDTYVLDREEILFIIFDSHVLLYTVTHSYYTE